MAQSKEKTIIDLEQKFWRATVDKNIEGSVVLLTENPSSQARKQFATT